MKATSKAQFRYLSKIAAGVIKNPSMSKEKASDAIKGVNPNNLPDRLSVDYPTRKTVGQARVIK